MEQLTDEDKVTLLVSPNRRRSQLPPPSPSSQSTRSRMVFETPPLRHTGGAATFPLPWPSPTASRHSVNLCETTELLPTATMFGSSTLTPRSMTMFSTTSYHGPRNSWQGRLHALAQAIPTVVIAVVLNLMICVPFGLSFFPVEWKEMPVPRALGIQMFLLTTAICQFVFVAKSSFDCTVGMMMVENVPFMHTLSMSIIQELGASSVQVLPTILVTYALSSIVVGLLFFVLGYFRLGNIIYLFPKHIIVGAIGGIGAFVLQSGIENATGQPFDWSWTGLQALVFDDSIRWLWVSSACLALTLSILTRWIRSPLFPPMFFVSIPPLFYLVLVVVGISPETARNHGWFFDRAPKVEFYAIWEQFRFDLVAWDVIPKQMGTILGLTLFSLMHVPINIPSLSLTTDMEVDINEELVAHGISNTLGGLCGSVQNYLCYSTSALYYKCGGGGRASGYAIAIIMLFFFLIGPNAVSYIPRCMAGCLMMHIGLDLLKEALLDTYEELDWMELGTVWIIAVCMTFWGMNQGLAVGALLACLTFVLQSARTPTCAPIRGSMSAATLRSNVWRTTEELDVLETESRHIHVVQLKGHLFFGNVNQLSEYVRQLFHDDHDIRYLVLDFTLVVGMDSSAADRLTKIKYVCDTHQCRVVFAAIPSAYDTFTSHLLQMFDGSDMFFIALDLNAALEWCENAILRQYALSMTFKKPLDKEENDDECAHLRSLQQLLPDQPLSVLHKLLDYFSMQELDRDQVLWKQGDVPQEIVLLVDGALRAVVEEEAGTTEDIAIGAVVGELCFLTGEKRKTTVVATKRSVVYVLTRESFEDLLANDCFLAFLLQNIALRYTSYRLQYVGNRIWETKCLPI